MRIIFILLFSAALNVCAQAPVDSSVSRNPVKKKVPVFVSDTAKVYFRFSLGYRFKAGIGVSRQYRQDANTNIQSYIPTSNGFGVPISVAFGRYLKPGIALELELTYKAGAKQTINNVFYDNSSQVSAKQKFSYISREFQISPRLIGEVKVNETFLQYKIGPVLSMGKNKSEIKEDYVNASNQTWSGSYAWEYTIKPGIGFTGGFGFRKIVAPNVSFIADLSFTQLGRWWDGSKMTESIENKTNTLNLRPVSSKETEAVDEIDYTKSQDPNKPTQAIRYKVEYSSVGFSVGFVQHF